MIHLHAKNSDHHNHKIHNHSHLLVCTSHLLIRWTTWLLPKVKKMNVVHVREGTLLSLTDCPLNIQVRDFNGLLNFLQRKVLLQLITQLMTNYFSSDCFTSHSTPNHPWLSSLQQVVKRAPTWISMALIIILGTIGSIAHERMPNRYHVNIQRMGRVISH